MYSKQARASAGAEISLGFHFAFFFDLLFCYVFSMHLTVGRTSFVKQSAQAPDPLSFAKRPAGVGGTQAAGSWHSS